MSGMEAAVASGVLKIVGNKLAPLLINEYSSIVGAEKDLQELKDQVTEINCWLETVGHELTRNNPSFNWLKKLKDVAYAIDDVVDEFQLEAEKHDAHGDGGTVTKYICTKPKSLILQCKVARKLKVIKKRFAAVVKQRSDFSAISNSLHVGHHHTMKTIVDTPTLPIVDEASVLGRDQEKNHIVSRLETNDQQSVKIVSVIGLGGSGKTTLAKLVFNDKKIIDKFDVRLWVHVSQEFDVGKLIKKLFESFADNNPGQHALPYMCKQISEKLTGKKFLLVMDDVWTESPIQWEKFMEHLKSGNPGSGILLTTRSTKVAEKVRSTYQFNMPLLSPDVSWQLFQQSLGVLGKGLESEFVMVGKEIVGKCGGVPLAIKVLAGVLHDKELKEEWQAICDGNLLDVEGGEDSISVSACLRLSYFHLPSHLKQCFTICSVFPKGIVIDKETLIDLWIAHNMITLVDGVDSLEYSGHKCFTSLVQMSFLQDVVEEYGRVRCRMHDLCHDLAQSILDDEISLVLPQKTTCSKNSYRYFSLVGEINLPPKNLFGKARAIYVANGGCSNFGKALQKVKHLRSITLDIYAIPTCILKIKHLRYLAISSLACEVLPEDISEIWCLQALHVTNCCALRELPRSIGKLKKLRVLNLSQCSGLQNLPDSIGDCHMISRIDLCGCGLTALPNSIGRNKNLTVLRLGHSNIGSLPSSITTLGNLECLDLRECRSLVELPSGMGNLKKLVILNIEGCNLKGVGNIYRNGGYLIIRDIPATDPVTDLDYVLKACLKKKSNLQSLELQWNRYNMDDVNPEKVLAVLDALEPPSDVKSLHIRWYAGGQFANWMLKQVGGRVQGDPQFSWLTVMKLSDFRNLKYLNGLVEFPFLKELWLTDMPALESISGGPFPSLVRLSMVGMDSLGEVFMVEEGTLPRGEQGETCGNHSRHHFRQLQIGSDLSYLWISSCPKVQVKPYFPSSLLHLTLCRSNEQLLLALPSQDQGSLSFSGCSFSHLKELVLWDMTTSAAAAAAAPPVLGSGEHGWELLQHMTTLESLKIDSDGLTELPGSMRSLTSLKSLSIRCRSVIRVLPEWIGELRSLLYLTIETCDNLSSLPQSLGQLSSLRCLRIGWCDALHQLPECLGELRSLCQLELYVLGVLTGLPQSICHLTSLQQLKIWFCPGIKSLPDGMKGLSALERLEIGGCPDLKRRCNREKGEDWHLISHIPHQIIQ